MALSWFHTKKICALGVSTFIFLFNESVVQILVNLLLRYWSPDSASGDLYIGCMTIVYSMSQIFFMPLQGITQGAQPIVGYCMGASDYGRMKKTIHYARICSLTCVDSEIFTRLFSMLLIWLVLTPAILATYSWVRPHQIYVHFLVNLYNQIFI